MIEIRGRNKTWYLGTEEEIVEQEEINKLMKNFKDFITEEEWKEMVLNKPNPYGDIDKEHLEIVSKLKKYKYE